MALQRAFESHRPQGTRLFSDPYADAFLRRSLRLVAAASGVPGLRCAVARLYDAIGGTGARPSAIVRTRVIDDAIGAAAQRARQCVLLGAGYDTRAHRLPALANVRVFEVDQPATQRVKRAIIARIGLGDAHVAYVPIDFERDDLADALTSRGFDPTQPTVFLWEGVTQYLTDGAVDATLATIRELAPTGTGNLIFTYVDVRALERPSPFPDAARWVRAVARAGEPWIFGLHPDATATFLAGRGFSLRYDTSTFEAGRGLLAARGGRDRPSMLYRIAIADISSQEAAHDQQADMSVGAPPELSLA